MAVSIFGWCVLNHARTLKLGNHAADRVRKSRRACVPLWSSMLSDLGERHSKMWVYYWINYTSIGE